VEDEVELDPTGVEDTCAVASDGSLGEGCGEGCEGSEEEK